MQASGLVLSSEPAQVQQLRVIILVRTDLRAKIALRDKHLELLIRHLLAPCAVIAPAKAVDLWILDTGYWSQMKIWDLRTSTGIGPPAWCLKKVPSQPIGENTIQE